MVEKETLLNQLPEVLVTASKLIYQPLGYKISNYQTESESQEYNACTFQLNHLKIKHRLSKITPKKTGQFVTIWKRNNLGITIPFDDLDDFDLLIISSETDKHFGQFIFPKAILAQHKIITNNGVEGKRGIRV